MYRRVVNKKLTLRVATTRIEAFSKTISSMLNMTLITDRTRYLLSSHLLVLFLDMFALRILSAADENTKSSRLYG